MQRMHWSYSVNPTRATGGNNALTSYLIFNLFGAEKSIV